MQPKFFRTAGAFERWLAANHRKAGGLLVGFYKVSSGRLSITYSQALDAALAYGWIDGVRQWFDDEAYTIRFTQEGVRVLPDTSGRREAALRVLDPGCET